MSSIIITYLRRERRKWGLTQQELAFLLGMKSRAHISALENGTRLPTATQLLMFQLLFGMTAAQLFPQLLATSEQALLAKVRELQKHHEGVNTLRASRTEQLLRHALTRAVMS